MEKKSEILKYGIEALTNEANAILHLINNLNEDFENTVHTIFKSKGRVVVTGIGKSAIIAQKIAATFNSTGTRALFMHAADAVHGDLGMIMSEDVVIFISKSGETPEIIALLPILKTLGNKIIAITGNINSSLSKAASLVINVTIEKEACPNNLAPTTSTTAQLAMGDAIAVALLHIRRFGVQDFAKVHPGGILGKKLYLTLGDLCENDTIQIASNASLPNIISAITSGRKGAVAIIDNKCIVGIITDGDLRRLLEKTIDIKNIYAHDIMNNQPCIADEELLASDALLIFREKKISQIIVQTKEGLYAGMVHLHDLNREGII